MIKVRINLRNHLSYQKKPQDFYADSPKLRFRQWNAVHVSASGIAPWAWSLTALRPIGTP
jgi:hypothetical protein